MTAQADVYIKNLLEDDLQVTRYLPDGSIDLDSTLVGGEEDRFYLPDTEVYLTIGSAIGLDTRDWPFTVRSDVDFLLRYSKANSNWMFKLESNDLSPDAPTTVYIIVGQAGPPCP